MHQTLEYTRRAATVVEAAGELDQFMYHCRTPMGRLPQYPFLTRYVDALNYGGDCAIAKSRQMLGSWGACAVLLHRLMHVDGYAALVTSRKQQLVDDGGENSTTSSLMGRIRYLYDSLPPYIKDRAPVTFNHLRAVCRKHGSHIIGEGTTTNVARGGTFDNVLADEWAFVPQSELAFSSIRAACKSGVWLLSTPNGPDGNFARVWRENPAGFDQVRLHWTEHPLRYHGEVDPDTGRPTSEWYRQMCASMTPDQIARELDIDFSRSASGLVYPEFSYDKHMSNEVAYDSALPLYGCMDFGIGAATAAYLFQVAPSFPRVRVLHDYEMENAPAEVNARNVWAMAQQIGFKGLRSEVRWYGDPAGNAREIATGSSVIREYRHAGFTNFTTPRVKKLDGIRLVRRFLHRGDILFSVDCAMTALRIADYRYPTDDSGAVKGDEPVKNKATHLMDALRYGVTGLFPTDEGVMTSADLTFDRPRVPLMREPEPLAQLRGEPEYQGRKFENMILPKEQF